MGEREMGEEDEELGRAAGQPRETWKEVTDNEK